MVLENTFVNNNKLQHIAIILDGNGRWAKIRGWERIRGHEEGVKRIKDIGYYANKLGIKYLTIYCFSTENWKRSVQEVNYLLEMPARLIDDKRIKEFSSENIKLNHIGNLSGLPIATQSAFKKAMVETKKNTGLTLTFAFNYGGVEEILHAINQLKTQNTLINQSDLFNALYTKELPDVDLLIRTGGELRTSNFLPLQIRYAELYFTKQYWPDFNESSLDEAIQDYLNRNRRFGGISS